MYGLAVGVVVYVSDFQVHQNFLRGWTAQIQEVLIEHLKAECLHANPE